MCEWEKRQPKGDLIPNGRHQSIKEPNDRQHETGRCRELEIYISNSVRRFNGFSFSSSTHSFPVSDEFFLDFIFSSSFSSSSPYSSSQYSRRSKRHTRKSPHKLLLMLKSAIVNVTLFMNAIKQYLLRKRNTLNRNTNAKIIFSWVEQMKVELNNKRKTK